MCVKNHHLLNRLVHCLWPDYIIHLEYLFEHLMMIKWTRVSWVSLFDISNKNRMHEENKKRMEKMEFPCNSFTFFGRRSVFAQFYGSKARREKICIFIWNKILYCSLSSFSFVHSLFLSISPCCISTIIRWCVLCVAGPKYIEAHFNIKTVQQPY